VTVVTIDDEGRTPKPGLGTYLGDTTLRAELLLGFLSGPLSGMAMVFADEITPKIWLDSGKTVYGYECWWTPVETSTSN
jgi:hypothetical protein